MTKITKDDVLRVARLAHLELSDAEVDTFSRQLDGILTYVDKLNELDTTGVEPMAVVVPPAASEDDVGVPVAPGTPLREDIEVPCGVAAEILAEAPDPDPPYFRVPKVIDR